MHALVPLIFATLLYAAQGELTPRIVGGRDVPIGKYPFQVSLKFLGHHNCGGSILDRYNILTAAHCIKGRNASEAKVHAGTNFLNVSGDVYEIEKFVPHKRFDNMRIINDIGLLHLKNPISFHKRVQTVELSTTDTNTEGKPCTAIGWGYTKVNSKSSNSLQEVALKIFPRKKCKKWWPQVRYSNVCTYTKVGEGVCRTDSGGPLIINNTQIGIVSYGQSCAVGHPDVYARVSSYIEWINENLKK